MKGTNKVSPAFRVREYRPSRSTIPAFACGTIRIDRARVTTTNSANTAPTTVPTTLPDDMALPLTPPARWPRRS